MKPRELVVEGTLTEDGQILIEGKPNLPPGRVRVTLQRIEDRADTGHLLFDTLEKIWAAQERRGYRGQPWEELVAELDAGREQWDDAGAAPNPALRLGQPDVDGPSPSGGER